MAGKIPQVLTIDPANELSFLGPFTDVVTSFLVLSNPQDKPVCFKVKTTAPKQYCVRPNSGLVPAFGSVKVAVMLQPFEYSSDEKSKHKFMVQTAFVPEGETSPDNIWKTLGPNDMMDSKLRVVFEQPQSRSVDTFEQKTASPLKSVDLGIEQELRKTHDDKKRLEKTVRELEAEQEKLRKALEMASKRDLMPGGEAMIETRDASFASILIAVVALIIGLVLGSLLF